MTSPDSPVRRSPFWNYSPAGLMLGLKHPDQLMAEGRIAIVGGQPMIVDGPASHYDRFVGSVRAVEPERHLRRAAGLVMRLADRRRPRCVDIDTDDLLSSMAGISLAAGGMGWVQAWDIGPLVPLEVPWKVVEAKLSKLVRRGLLDGCTCGCRGDFTLTSRGIERVEDHLTDGEIDQLLRFEELARP